MAAAERAGSLKSTKGWLDCFASQTSGACWLNLSTIIALEKAAQVFQTIPNALDSQRDETSQNKVQVLKDGHIQQH